MENREELLRVTLKDGSRIYIGKLDKDEKKYYEISIQNIEYKPIHILHNIETDDIY